MKDMGKGIPVRDVLGIAGTKNDAFPQLDMPIGSDQGLAEEKEDQGLEGDEGYGEGGVLRVGGGIGARGCDVGCHCVSDSF